MTHKQELDLGSGREKSRIKGIARKAGIGVAAAILATTLSPYGLAQKKSQPIRREGITKILRTNKSHKRAPHRVERITELLKYSPNQTTDSNYSYRAAAEIPIRSMANQRKTIETFSKKMEVNRGNSMLESVINSSKGKYGRENISLESSIKSTANRHFTTIIKMYNTNGSANAIRTNFGAVQQLKFNKRNSILLVYSQMNGRSGYNLDYVISDKKRLAAIAENYDGQKSRLNFLMTTGNKGIVMSYDQRSGIIGSSLSFTFGHKHAAYRASDLLNQQTNIISGSSMGLQGAFESAPRNSKNRIGDVLNFRYLYDTMHGMSRSYAVKNRVEINGHRLHGVTLDESFNRVMVLNSHMDSFGIGLTYRPKLSIVVPSVSYDTLGGIRFRIDLNF